MTAASSGNQHIVPPAVSSWPCRASYSADLRTGNGKSISSTTQNQHKHRQPERSGTASTIFCLLFVLFLWANIFLCLFFVYSRISIHLPRLFLLHILFFLPSPSISPSCALIAHLKFSFLTIHTFRNLLSSSV